MLNIKRKQVDVLPSKNQALCKFMKMQQYINILPYRNTLGSDAVSIHIKVISIYRVL